MSKKHEPYQVAEICLDLSNERLPWYVVRTGTVVEQGGLAFGEEVIRFESIESACNYLKMAIHADLDLLKNRIIELESAKQ